jgi:hypothetical protein
VALLVLIGGLFLLTKACVTDAEVMRAVSPDGELTARLFEVNGGATTDFSYHVDVERNWPLPWGRTVAGFYGAGRSDCADGVNIRWSGNRTLVVTYRDAKSADVDSTARISGRTISVVSRSGVNDPTAACGGMEYSQGGKVVVVH